VRLREPLLDLWRGLALIDMAWVHLAAYPIGMPPVLAAWLGEYTRFAAGAFVLLSGMTVARVFGPALTGDAGAASKARRRLLRRSLMLLCVGRLVSVGFAAIEQLRVAMPGTTPAHQDLWRVAAFGEPGVTGGLLLLYAFLLAATPLVAAFAKRRGPFATLLVSFAVYAVAERLGGLAHWPPWTFPLAHWQPFFVVGYVASPLVERLRTGGALPRRVSLGAVTAAAGFVFLIRNAPALGLDGSLSPAWEFTKVPLRPAEMVWYFSSAAFVLSWSGWAYVRWESVRSATGWLCRLGRWSLLVYVAHLFLELPIVDVLTVLDPSPWGRAVMLVIIAAMMNVVAVLADHFEAWRPATVLNPLTLLRRSLPVAGTIGGGLAVACLGCVLLLARFGVDPASAVALYPPVDGDMVIVVGHEAAMGDAVQLDVRELTGDAEARPVTDVAVPRPEPSDGLIVPAPASIDVSAEDALIVQ